MEFDTFLTVASFVTLGIVGAVRVLLSWIEIRKGRKRWNG